MGWGDVMRKYAFVVAAACLAGTSAQSQTTIGTTVDISTYYYGGGTYTFGNGGYAGSAGDGEIARNYLQFSIATAPQSVVSSATLNLSYAGSYGIAQAPLSIFEVTNNFDYGTSWYDAPAFGALITTFNPQDTGTYSFDVTNYVNAAYLAGGTVSFAIAGTIESADPGSPNSWRYFYGGNETLSFTTAASGAVPEPASWALILGGFGLVGGAMRSRRAKAAVSFI